MPPRPKSPRVQREFRPTRERRQTLAQAYESVVLEVSGLRAPTRPVGSTTAQGGVTRAQECAGGAG